MEETLFEQTLKFSDANEEERDRIYSDIGFNKIMRVKVTGPRTEALKASGVDVTAFNNYDVEKITIFERIVHGRYSNLLIKKIPVEIFSDYENKSDGWINTCQATDLFYFFDDCVLSVKLGLIRKFVNDFLSEESVSDNMDALINAFISAGIQGKTIPDHKGIEAIVEAAEGAHRVSLLINVDALEDTDVPITEFMFEEESETEENPQEEQESE